VPGHVNPDFRAKGRKHGKTGFFSLFFASSARPRSGNRRRTTGSAPPPHPKATRRSGKWAGPAAAREISGS